MKILAFETSAKAASAALVEDGRLLCESYQNTGLTHSQTLMAMAEAMLQNGGFLPEQIDAVAAAAGPGSFTGVRIGVAAAKGFAWGRDIPCCGVSTLEAMARNLGAFRGYVLPVMDARRQQVYTALFRAENGECARVLEDQALSLEELTGKIQSLEAPVFLVGDGSALVYQALKDAVPALVLPPEHRMHQRAAGVALAAEKMLLAGQECSGQTLTPNYLRVSQAERERMAREK